MTEEQKKYKEEQRRRMSNYKVGGKDLSGNTITKVFSFADEYMVYEIQTKELADSIKVLIDSELEDDKQLGDRLNDIRANFSKLKGLLYKVNDDTSVKTRIAHIISHALNGKAEEANTQFNSLIVEINNEYSCQFNHRLRYLITILIFTFISISFSIYVYSNKLFFDVWEVRQLIFIATAGSIGSFLSVSRRLKDTVFEKDVNKYLYIAYGAERVFISVFGAVVLYFAMRSNLIFGIVNELAKPIYGYIVFSVVAGFSETLVPNLLIKLEQEHD